MKFATITLLVTAAAIAGAQSTVKTPPTTGPEATAVQPAKPAVKTYTSEELGLSFDYPASWKKTTVLVKNNSKFQLTDPKSWKPQRVENTTRFLMPLPGTDEKGTLEIYSIQFNADTDIWESSQRDINAQLKRTVVKQWKEEMLGVPLLMTKIESNDKNEKLVTETGMVYSATPRKLVFRVYASPDNFDKADAAWREVIQSVKTVDGHLPSAEDPSRRLSPAEINPGTYRKTVWTIVPPAKLPVEKGSVVTDAIASGKKLHLLTPAGWKVTANSDGTFIVSNPSLSGTMKVAVYSAVDSDPAGKNLIRATGLSLDPFTKVEKREEKGPYTSRSQMTVVWIYRRGLAGTAPHFSYDAAGASTDYYWLLTWSSDNGTAATSDRKALDALTEVMSVEPADKPANP